MKHPKTTISGILTILSSTAAFVALWLSGHPPTPESISALMGTYAVGYGLITAADAKPPTP